MSGPVAVVVALPRGDPSFGEVGRASGPSVGTPLTLVPIRRWLAT